MCVNMCQFCFLFFDSALNFLYFILFQFILIRFLKKKLPSEWEPTKSVVHSFLLLVSFSISFSFISVYIFKRTQNHARTHQLYLVALVCNNFFFYFLLSFIFFFLIALQHSGLAHIAAANIHFLKYVFASICYICESNVFIFQFCYFALENFLWKSCALIAFFFLFDFLSFVLSLVYFFVTEGKKTHIPVKDDHLFIFVAKNKTKNMNEHACTP